MAFANILRSYLIQIGFDIKKSDIEDFKRQMSDSAVAVGKVAGAAGAMVTAVAAAVQITARKFEDLYYASQRTGVSAENLMKFRFAAEQVGIAAGTMESQAESLAKALRDTPPLKQFMQGIIGATGDVEEAIAKLAEWYRKQAQLGSAAEAVARRTIEVLHIDPDVIRQFAQNLDQFIAAGERYKQILREMGLNASEAAKLSVTETRNLNELFTRITIVWDKLSLTLLPALNKAIIEINAALTRHMGDIQKFVDGPVREWIAWISSEKGWNTLRQNVQAVTGDFRDLVLVMREVAKVFETIAAGARVVKEAVSTQQARMKSAEIGPPAEAVERQRRLYYQQGLGDFMGSPKDEPPGSLGHKLWDWLTHQTHSPNVEIFEAKGVWSRMRDWLMGSATTAPPVKIVKDETKDFWANLFRQAFGGDAVRPGGGAGRGVGPVLRPGQPVPNIAGMTAQESNFLALAEKYESGGRNIMNFIGDMLHTAQGFWQITNTNWRRLAPQLGITTPDAMHASRLDQAKVALALLRESGPGNWTRYNARLSAALAFGEHLGGDPGGQLRSAMNAIGRPGQLAAATGQSSNQIIASPTTTIHVYGGSPDVGRWVFDAQKRVSADLVRNLAAAAF